MVEILQEINRIRKIRDDIEQSNILNLELLANIIQSKEILHKGDKDLFSLYFKSILELVNLLIEKYGEEIESEALVKYLLEISNDSRIREEAYEKLLRINELKNNPYNNMENVKKIVHELIEAYRTYYNPDTSVDMYKLQSNLYGYSFLHYRKTIDKLFNDAIVNELIKVKSPNIKGYLVENLLIYVNKNGFRGSLGNDYISKFFQKIKLVAEFDEELLARVNERIYHIPFDTHGAVNKFDKIKNKIFKKKN